MRPSPAGAPTVRLADPERDAPDVAAIYAPHVTDGLASFEAVPPDAHGDGDAHGGQGVRWAPWLVAGLAAESGDARVVGYAYAARHAERAGYRWDVNLSVYVAPAWQGRGIGRRLYDALVPILRLQRFPQRLRRHRAAEPCQRRASTRRSGCAPRRPTSGSAGSRERGWTCAWLHMPLAAEFPAEPTHSPDADRAGRTSMSDLEAARSDASERAPGPAARRRPQTGSAARPCQGASTRSAGYS